MKLNYIISCILFATLGMHAQVVQTGRVLEYNEDGSKTPLSGVEISVRSASTAVSDSDGNFSITFLPTMYAGDRITVRHINKAGYEVFNKDALEQWNLNPKTPFVIVMCESDKFKKIRDKYSANYKKQLDREILKLNKLKEDNQTGGEEEIGYVVKRLEDENENITKNIQELTNSLYRQVEALLISGEENNYAKAANLLMKLSDSDTMNVELLINTGRVLDTYLHDYDLALEYYAKALNASLKQYGETSPQTANSYSYLGRALFLKKDYEKALECYNKALSLSESRIADQYPDPLTLQMSKELIKSSTSNTSSK